MKILMSWMVSWMPIILFGTIVVVYHTHFGKPTPTYPDVTDPRIRQCAITDLPLTSLKHYHLLMDRGFLCYSIRSGKEIREYRLSD